MKNLLAIPCLMVLLAACGGTSTVEETTSAENSIATVQSELAFIQCGMGCPPGSAPYAYRCYGGCGTCSAGDEYTSVNGTGCDSTTDSLGNPVPYYACGLGQSGSSGHYNAGYMIDRYCDAGTSSNGGTVPNKTYYPTLPTDGRTFLSCGLGCPSGYSVVQYYAASGCNPSGETPSSPNSTYCK